MVISVSSAWSADDSLGFSTPVTMPCFDVKEAFKKNPDDKDPFERADVRLKAAFAVNPFSHKWPGEKSDFVFDKKKALVRVHDDYQFLASLAGEAPVQTLAVMKACVDVNNQPFFFIANRGEQPAKVQLKDGKVTLGKGMNSDTYLVNVNPRPAHKLDRDLQPAAGGSSEGRSAPAVSSQPQPVAAPVIQ